MQKINKIEDYFHKGFVLEYPSLVLPWKAPLNDLASASGGIWNSDRYYWRATKFLGGLEYPLMSKAGITKEAPFKEITALVGIDPNTGLWSDSRSLRGFEYVSQHLFNLIGAPSNQSSSESTSEPYVSWESQSIHIYLGIIEMHCYRCNLTIAYLEE